MKTRVLERLLVSTQLILRGHLLNPVWWPSERRRARRSEVFGSVLADYLKRHYLSSLNNIPNDGIKQDEPEKIWSIWFQGEASAPQLVKNCYSSIRKYCNKELVVLDNESLWQYITLPDRIKDQFAKGKISYAHMADICRVELLYEHGGYWMDATDFVTYPIPELIEKSDFFVYHAGHKISGYYSFIQNCFIHARKGSYLLAAWRAMILDFWTHENKRIDYFQHQIMFRVIVENDSKAKELHEQMPYIEHDANHALWYTHGREKAEPQNIDKLVPRENFFQKTSFKEVHGTVLGSWRDWILNQKEEELS